MDIFCNGKWISENTPCIEVNDRGFLYGDAAFTTILINDGKVYHFDLHKKRLAEQCLKLNILAPVISFEDIQQLIDRNKAHFGSYKLKIIITGGNSLKLSLPQREYGKFLMTLQKISLKNLPELKLTLFPMPISKPTSYLKTLSYLDRLFVSDYAVKNGFDDAIVLSKEGYVTEAAFSNIFWRIDQDIFIPDPSLDLSFGVTLTYLLDVFKKIHFNTHFVKEKLENISEMAEVFTCNALKGVIPVIAIDEKKFKRDIKLEKEILKHVEHGN